jgi:hypothetical protein
MTPASSGGYQATLRRLPASGSVAPMPILLSVPAARSNADFDSAILTIRHFLVL